MNQCDECYKNVSRETVEMGMLHDAVLDSGGEEYSIYKYVYMYNLVLYDKNRHGLCGYSMIIAYAGTAYAYHAHAIPAFQLYDLTHS